MRIVVTGATGNVGTAVVRALRADPEISSIVGVARRPGPSEWIDERVSWRVADISTDSLSFFEGADAVIHLAWVIQPSRDEAAMRQTNVIGSTQVARAVQMYRVPALIYASSVGTYALRTKAGRVGESWSAAGIETSTYSRHKAEVEAMLDEFEVEYPDVRVVRMRTSLVFQREAASEIHRLFLGRFLPWHLPRPLRLIPNLSTLQFQATHADDIADAYVRVTRQQVRGAFNVAAEPVLDTRRIAEAVNGRPIPISRSLLRFATATSYRMRLQPTEPGWLDLATGTPLMDTTRIRSEVGWSPVHSSVDTLKELLGGMGDGAGGATVPLRGRQSKQRTSAPIDH